MLGVGDGGSGGRGLCNNTHDSNDYFSFRQERNTVDHVNKSEQILTVIVYRTRSIVKGDIATDEYERTFASFGESISANADSI